MVTSSKGIYSRRKESTGAGLEAPVPPPGQYNYFISRAFDSFVPVLKSYFFFQMSPFSKYYYFSDSRLSKTMKKILLSNHF